MARSIGRQIRLYRRLLNMTQVELAARIGVTQGSLGAWETDQKNPTADKLPLIAQALGVPIEALFAEPAITQNQIVQTLAGATDTGV